MPSSIETKKRRANTTERGDVDVKDLVALEFRSDEDHRTGLREYLEERPTGYLASPGRNTMIIPRAELSVLKKRLHGLEIDENAVGSMGDLPPDEAARVRRGRNQPLLPELRDPEWKRAKLRELRARLGGGSQRARS
jgi:hypothetical protein